VSVNLSARQFEDKHLLREIERALSESSLKPNCLELEITESMVMRDTTSSKKILDGIKSMGIRLAIDDFGTGYSSLASIKRFPFDCIKIDRSFIKDIPQDPDDVAITQAIIAMAHSLRLKVIAEGVETQEQLDFLTEHGCHEFRALFPQAAAGGRFLQAAARAGTLALAAAMIAPRPSLPRRWRRWRRWRWRRRRRLNVAGAGVGRGGQAAGHGHLVAL
jgi:sensor c-di-GMP phosphodiesterase-like protein